MFAAQITESKWMEVHGVCIKTGDAWHAQSKEKMNTLMSGGQRLIIFVSIHLLHTARILMTIFVF